MAEMRRFLVLVAAVVLVDTVFFAVLSPLLPAYAAALGLSKSAVGVLAGAFAAGVLVAALPSGLLASRLGLRPTLLLGLGLTAVTSVLFGLADEWILLVLDALRGRRRQRVLVDGGRRLARAHGAARAARRADRLRDLRGRGGRVPGPRAGRRRGVARDRPGLRDRRRGVRRAGQPGSRRLAEPETESRSVTMVAALGIPSLRVPLGLILLAPLLFAVLGVLVPLSLGTRGWGAGRLGALYAAAAALEAIVHPLLGRWADRQGALAPISAGLVGSTACSRRWP